MRFYSLSSAALALALPALGQAPTVRVIPDEPSCARCTISARRLVTLGTDDGVGSLNGKPMSVNVDSRGRYWLFQELEPATVFNANGTVVRMIGRKGRGPGEFQASNYGVAVGDSMLVFDWVESRATMIDPGLTPGRTIRIMQSMGDVVPMAWPILVMDNVNLAKGANGVLHRISLGEPELRILDSFGPRNTSGPMNAGSVWQQIGSAPNGLWSTYVSRPEFTRWDADGRAVATFKRQLAWFTGDAEPTLGWGRSAPTPMTGLIHEDESGLVWFFVYRPVANWKDPWKDVRPLRIGAGTEIRMRDVPYDKLFDTHIEVIDPVAGRVIARHNFDGYIFQALPSRRVAQYVVDADGIPRVHIVSLTLNGR